MVFLNVLLVARYPFVQLYFLPELSLFEVKRILWEKVADNCKESSWKPPSHYSYLGMAINQDIQHLDHDL